MQEQNTFFAEVDEDYILDRFNLTGLTSAGPHFQLAIDKIIMSEEQFFEETAAARKELAENMEVDEVGDSSETPESKIKNEIQASALHLYGLIHARYIITSQGLTKMVSFLLFANYCRKLAVIV